MWVFSITEMRTRWNATEWKQVKPEIKKAMAEKSRVQRAGWFNYASFFQASPSAG